MKAIILRDNAADAVQTTLLLARKGFQTFCVSSRDIAKAMIDADTIDLIVMDERVGKHLTHSLALSAERRNPYVSTIIVTDQGAEATDDLYALIPSLYALIGTRTGADMMGQIVLSAVGNADEAARRIDRRLAAEAAELATPVDDDLWADEADDDIADVVFAAPAMHEIAAASRGWGDTAGHRLHPVQAGPAFVPSGNVCA